jgi:O-antigen/teichoic acid export membrane protein
MGVAAVANFGLNLVLIPLYGSAGAAASTLIAYVLLALVAYVANQRIYPVPYEMKRFLAALFLGLALYLIASLVSHEWSAFWRWSLIIACLVFYGGTLLFLGGGRSLLRVRGASVVTRIFSDRRVS